MSDVVLNPVEVVRRLMQEGVDNERAAVMAEKWVDYLHARVMSENRRKENLKRFSDEARKLSEQPGGCYLRMVRWNRRERVWNALGAHPTLEDIMLLLSSDDFDNDAMSVLAVCQRSGGLHVYPSKFAFVGGASLVPYLSHACEVNNWMVRFDSTSCRVTVLPVLPGLKVGRNEDFGGSQMVPRLGTDLVLARSLDGGKFRCYENDGQSEEASVGCTTSNDLVVMSFERYLFRYHNDLSRKVLVICDKPYYRNVIQDSLPSYHYMLCFDHGRGKWIVTSASSVQKMSCNLLTQEAGHIDAVDRGFFDAFNATGVFCQQFSCDSIWRFTSDMFHDVPDLVGVRCGTKFSGQYWIGRMPYDEMLRVMPETPFGVDKLYSAYQPQDVSGKVVECNLRVLKEAWRCGWSFEGAKMVVVTQLPLWMHGYDIIGRLPCRVDVQVFDFKSMSFRCVTVRSTSDGIVLCGLF